MRCPASAAAGPVEIAGGAALGERTKNPAQEPLPETPAGFWTLVRAASHHESAALAGAAYAPPARAGGQGEPRALVSSGAHGT